MKFKFNFHQVDPSQALMIYSREEIEKAGKLLLSDSSCQVIYRMGRYECQVQVDVDSSWGHFKAVANAENFYIATDQVAEKLGKQFKKMKEKHQSHKKVDRSKHSRLKRLNAQLEYDNSPFFNKKTG